MRCPRAQQRRHRLDADLDGARPDDVDSGPRAFYGGMVRKKNMASILSQVFAIVALVSIVWVLYGYSLAFTEGSHQLVPFAAGDHPWLGFLQGYEWNNLVGGLDRAFLKGITPDSNVPTFSNGVAFPNMSIWRFR